MAVLARASAAIIHGGFGTIKECILYQVPMLIVPFLFDQPANATKIEELGLGVVVESKDADSARVRRGLELLLKTPDFRKQIRSFREAAIKEDGYDAFCSSVVVPR